MKKLLVTGANGFIGSTIVEQAINRGWKVTAAIRKGSNTSHLLPYQIEYLELDYSNKIDLVNKFSKIDKFEYIIHNAGTTKAANKDEYLKVNVAYTQNLVEALIESHKIPEKFLFVSSLAAIGPVKHGQTIDNNTKPNPVTWYGESKLSAEQYFDGLSEFPWTIIRPTAVYGPKDKDIFVFIKMVSKGLEFYIGKKEQELSFIYSEDLADLMLTIVEKSPLHQKYIGSDFKQYKSADLGNSIKISQNKSTLKLKIPAIVITSVAYVFDFFGKLSGKVPTLNLDKMNELKAESWWCNPKNVKTNLNWQPKNDLYSGMKNTIEWYQKHKWL
ncbi:MAG: NAD(P)-dependent oxidoreductase [Saprospiraceae bacterium]|nr:NAD(P)-dependent oxidoreductase [Saprospiraceae bacterium]